MEIRERIISGSLEMFLTHGVKSVTMDEVAATLGVSKRTIYENFSNKKELIEACIDAMQCREREREDDIVASSKGIIDEIFTFFALLDADFNRKGKFGYDIRKYYPEIFERRYICQHEEMKNKFKARLQQGIDEGVILPYTNLDFAVYVIIETIYNILSHPEVVFDSTKVSVTDAFKYVMIYFFRGIATRKGIKEIDEKLKKLYGEN